MVFDAQLQRAADKGQRLMQWRKVRRVDVLVVGEVGGYISDGLIYRIGLGDGLIYRIG